MMLPFTVIRYNYINRTHLMLVFRTKMVHFGLNLYFFQSIVDVVDRFIDWDKLVKCIHFASIISTHSQERPL